MIKLERFLDIERIPNHITNKRQDRLEQPGTQTITIEIAVQAPRKELAQQG